MNRLKELRNARGIKQETVATFLQVANGTYSRYENGHIVMTPKTLCKLSEYFNVAIDYIIGNIDYPLSIDKMGTLYKLSHKDIDFILGNNKLFSIEDKSNRFKELSELFNSLSIEEIRKMVIIVKALNNE